MRTVLEIACTGTEIQNRIEIRQRDIGSDQARRVAGCVENDELGVPISAGNYESRTSKRGSGSVAVVVLQHAALAFSAPNRAFVFELFFGCRHDEFVVQG